VIGGDPHQPRTEGASLIEPPERAKGAQEGLLSRVLGFRRVAEDQVGKPEGSLLVKVDELLPCCRIAFTGAADAFGFGQRGLSGEVSPRLYTAGAAGVPDGPNHGRGRGPKAE
jgi:hypothetical protein